jgi:hypothetical protein
MIQFVLNAGGFIIMAINFYMISFFFDLPKKTDSQTAAHIYLAFSPMAFLVGLAMFVLPSLWQVEKNFAPHVTKFHAWSGWSSF